ncbi:MAG: AAA family ATPase [Bradymonadia bacterium]
MNYEKTRELKDKLSQALATHVVGQKNVIELMLTGLLAQGHCLFVGVPGLGKTLLVRSVAQALDLNFSRIQFTPDLMPSDITGTEIIDHDELSGKRGFRFLEGPIFTNLLLADEINRTPPKTQAALLQAMQEHIVTVGGQNRTLGTPFLVFATQNPIEQEGTYPLPEAQLDRFMLMIEVDYPSVEEEVAIVNLTTTSDIAPIEPVLTQAELVEAQSLVRQMPVADNVVDYAVQLVRKTRPNQAHSPDIVQEYVSFGAGPRASQNLILAGKAYALMNGRTSVERSDIRTLAVPVLRHRLVTNFKASAANVTSAQVIEELLETSN